MVMENPIPARNENSVIDVDEENQSKEESFEEEVQLIMDIYPKFQIETVRQLLMKAEDQSNRFKTVLKELSMRNKTEEPLSLPQKADEEKCESSQTTFRTNEVILISSDDDDNIFEDLNVFLDRLQRSSNEISPNTTETKVRDHKLSKPAGDDDIGKSSASKYFMSKSQLEKLSVPEKVSRITLMLPKADPNYLKMQVQKYESKPENLNLFIRNALKNHDYPPRLTGSSTQHKKDLQPQLKKSGSYGKTFNGLSKTFTNSRPKTSKRKKQKRYDDEIDLDVLFNRPSKNLPRRFPKSNIKPIAIKTFPQKFGQVRDNFPKFNSFTKKTEDPPVRLEINQNQASPKQISQTQELSTVRKEDLALYTTQFNVEKFLEVIPDPDNYFRENRYGKPWSTECERYATFALYNIYKEIDLLKIKECISIAPNFLAACRMLDEETEREYNVRYNFPMPPVVCDVPLLREIAFKIHHEKIMKFVKTQSKIAEEKEDGLMQTCNCCYNEEILPENMLQCEADCWFCKECIRTSVEMSFQNGKVLFNCLNHCQAEYNFHTLEKALPAELFSKILTQKRNNEHEVFEESSILSFQCDENELAENVMARTYVENKMSEAIIRECPECRLKFVKSIGCNTIACPCGNQICYVCRDPVIDLFSHRQCQKYSIIKLDEERVMKAAREAKIEVLGILKIDPSDDIKTYFDNLRKINLELKRSAEAGNLLETSHADILQIEPAVVAPKTSKRKRKDTASFAVPPPRRSNRLAAKLK